jgi:hypothetical protein
MDDTNSIHLFVLYCYILIIMIYGVVEHVNRYLQIYLLICYLFINIVFNLTIALLVLYRHNLSLNINKYYKTFKDGTLSTFSLYR